MEFKFHIQPYSLAAAFGESSTDEDCFAARHKVEALFNSFAFAELLGASGFTITYKIAEAHIKDALNAARDLNLSEDFKKLSLLIDLY